MIRLDYFRIRGTLERYNLRVRFLAPGLLKYHLNR